MDEITLTGYTPGALGRIVELQADYYARRWGLGLYFEAKAATEMAEFLSRFDAERDGAWFAHAGGQIVGGIFIAGARADDQDARLRWFIIDEAYQGLGLGKRLMDAAMEFCRRQQFRRVYLTTFHGLAAARHLYEKYGFRLRGEEDGSHLTGNAALIEQVFEWLPNADA
ncbi:MAG: GNAT family N-acetyltransferase [Anaerolineae bacterium]|nr:GNAT family N-acetyltransferase [Anaerolineae bacterium]